VTSIRRARLAFLAGLVGSLILAAFWFPFGELMHQRGELATLSGALAAVNAKNLTLRSEASALGSDPVVSALAHGDYGLVKRGDTAIVILPGKGSSGGAGALGLKPIPGTDLVAQDVAAVPVATLPNGEQPGFWSRFADRLEFWRRPG